jgi:hypothetical protein
MTDTLAGSAEEGGKVAYQYDLAISLLVTWENRKHTSRQNLVHRHSDQHCAASPNSRKKNPSTNEMNK